MGLILKPRLGAPRYLAAGTLVAGLLSGLVCCSVLLVALGLPPGALPQEFILNVFFDADGLDVALTRAIPLILVGLSVAVTLRVRFWNIGIEGQVWIGAIAATAIVLYNIGPPHFRLLTMAVAACLAAGAWCALSAFAKLWCRADEVVTTLLMNYVAYLLTEHLLYGPWRNPANSYPVSRAFDAGTERLPMIGFGHVHAGLLLSVAAALFCWWLLSRTRFGMLARAVGANRQAAEAIGIPARWIIVLIAVLSGALSGLAGFTVVAGTEGQLTIFVGRDYVFPAFLIATVARSHPLGVVIVSIAVAGLYASADALKAFYELPQSVILVMQAILLLNVTVCDLLLRYEVSFRRRAVARIAP